VVIYQVLMCALILFSESLSCRSRLHCRIALQFCFCHLVILLSIYIFVFISKVMFAVLLFLIHKNVVNVEYTSTYYAFCYLELSSALRYGDSCCQISIFTVKERGGVLCI